MKTLFCDFEPSANVSSTPRDAIFTATTVFSEKIENLIKSFKTTRSNAILYIFTPANVIIPWKYLDANIVQVKESLESIRINSSPYKMRWEWYYTFICENEEKIDRIMHTDAFDAVFLGDPFSLVPSKDKLYVQLEDLPIKRCSYNKKWLKSCHPYVTKDFMRNTIACSGSLAGGVKPFKEFVEKMITHPEWPLCWGHGSDQGDFNYILWSNFYKFSFEIETMNCQSGFITINYCQNNVHFRNSGNKLLTFEEMNPLVYVHQYNRLEKTKEYIRKVCA